MSAYKRFVSYLYEYDHHKKGKNRGFVRVEVRDHQCRLELHMTLPVFPYTPSFQIYAFIARSGNLYGLPLGSACLKQGQVHEIFQIPDTRIGNSSWNLSDLDGLVVICDTGQHYATCWSDCRIIPEQLILPEATADLKAASLEPAATPPTEFPVNPFPPSSDSSTDSSPDIPPAFPGVSASDASVSAESSGSYTPVRLPAFSWKRLEDSYPQVTPFFDEEIHNCLQLSPKDISLLGSFGIPCGTNQFFLYGSHTFQHFLLGKMEHGDTTSYILAVPGIYEERERLLAGLFGFAYFKSARAKDAQPGHFGYWYRTIRTEPRNSDPISPGSPPAESFSEESAENSPAARASRM